METSENMNPWDLVKQQLELTLSPESYQNWVNRTHFGQIEGRLLRVHVPDDQTRAWMETEYADRVRSLLGGLGMGLDEVAYDVKLRGVSPVFNSPHFNGSDRKSTRLNSSHSS